jgi:hypothetical protein
MLDVMTNTQVTEQKQTISMPRLLLHLEGLAVLLGAVVLYGHVSGNWGAFLLLLLTPDLTMLGYLAGPKTGSVIYNSVHYYGLPIVLGLLALAGGWTTGLALALIWTAHIGMDRLFGYGFKYPSDFKNTHFQRM